MSQDNLMGTLNLKQPLMSIREQIDPPWLKVIMFVLFNALETCFPQSITDMSQVYSSSESHFAVRSEAYASKRALLCATPTERNRIGAR